MARDIFDSEIRNLQNKLLDLGLTVEQSIIKAIDILRRKDPDAARQLIEADLEINRERYAIESDILVVIARRQPMALDLRVLASILEIATELERIADYSKGIAKLTIRLRSQPLIKPLIDIPRMAEKAASMLRRSLVAFTTSDVDAAHKIASEDSEVDALYQQIYRELITYIICDPRNIEGASHLTWVAHNLERAADRVVNICERVVFMVTGELIEFDDPKSFEERG
ncbi:MAG: phosphate signaling complex protein PhoU [Syntrophobacteraceae bacterium]